MLVWDNKPLMVNGKFLKPSIPLRKNITVLTSNNGYIIPSKLSGYKDEVITVSNTPDQYYELTNYNITGSTMTGNSFAIENQDVSIQGVFTPIKYNITYQNDGHGSLNGGRITATGGQTTTLTATPNSYYGFKNYQVTGGTINGNTLTITSNCTAKANFSANKYTMTYQNDGHGTLTGNITTATGGQIVNLTATPSTYYAFKNYQITGGNINGNTVTITGNCTARANFSAINYTVSYTNDGHGTLTGGFNTATGGQTTTLTATPNYGYAFKNYQVTGGTISNNILTVTSNCTARGNFSAKPVRTVTLSQQTGGTIASNKSTGYDSEVVTLSNTATNGYTFTNYNVTGAILTGNQFAFNGSNVTAQAAFNHNVYNLTLQQKTGGTIGANKLTGYYGDTITLSNTANVGYTFNSYNITGATLTGNNFNIVGNNVSASPNFTHNVYNIVLQPSTGGKINANKTTGYYGDTITLSQTPSADCYFISYDVYGATLTGNQFKLVDNDVTVYANYSADYYKGKNVKIGNQTWATEDLNYLPDGMTLYDTWDEYQTTAGSPVTAHCYAYSSNVPNLGTAIIVKHDVISGSREDYCTYSRIGAIYAASYIANWRVPTSGDWNTLRTYVNTNTQTTNKAGYYLKSTADNGVDRYGFNITGTTNGSTMYVTTTTITTDPIVFYVNRNYDWLQDQLWYDVNYYRVRLIKDV